MKTLKLLYGALKKRMTLMLGDYDAIFAKSSAHFHFIGIGGIGMSAIAFILKDRGFVVTGSDVKESAMIEKLRDHGIVVHIGHSAANIRQGIDLVVVSSAISRANPEIMRSLELGIPIVKRSFVLGRIMKGKKGIAISGTHGKTTTTTMLTLITQSAGLDPTALIGGEVKNIGGNFLSGVGEYVIVEACEYDRSFLDLYPYMAVITNIEEDHLDYYRDLNEIKTAFATFVQKIPDNGLLIYAADDENCREVATKAKCVTVGFGFGSRTIMNRSHASYWEIEQIAQNKERTDFTINNGRASYSFSLSVPGKHNVANAAAAIIAAHFMGINMEVVRNVLSQFTGTKRRFQILGKRQGAVVVDDYAHHPAEILSTLEGARHFYPDRPIVVIFEAHQYSRTKALLADFGQSFGYADLVIIPDIYAVRDSAEDIASVSAQDLVSEIEKNVVKAVYIPTYDSIVAYLRTDAIPEDAVIITMGAGNVFQIGERYLNETI